MGPVNCSPAHDKSEPLFFWSSGKLGEQSSKSTRLIKSRARRLREGLRLARTGKTLFKAGQILGGNLRRSGYTCDTGGDRRLLLSMHQGGHSWNVPDLPVLFRQETELISQGFHFTPKQSLQDQHFLVIHQIRQGVSGVNVSCIELLYFFKSMGINEEAV